MKQTSMLILLAVFGMHTNGYAQSNYANPGTGLQQPVANAKVTKCYGSAALEAKDYNECLAVFMATSISGFKDNKDPDAVASQDRQVSCVKKNPLAIDYTFCTDALGSYNKLASAKKLMGVAQQVQTTSSQNKIQENYQKDVAQGNTQVGALDAMKDQNLNAAKMNEQQAYLYGTEASTLSFMMKKWPHKISRLEAVCERSKASMVTYVKEQIKSRFPIENPEAKHTINYEKLVLRKENGDLNDEVFKPANCAQILSNIQSELFQNKVAYAFFQGKILEATANGAMALLNANKLKKTADSINGIKDNYADEGTDALVELCRVDPANVQCKTSGNIVSGGAYQAGQFSLGNGSGQAFNLNPAADTTGELGNVGTTEGNQVADLTSPFADQADKASKMIDQAGGASYTSAGAGGGGGGGVGGGGGGGGLGGGDLAGPKSDKEAEIKASKVSAAYGGGGGGSGFTAMGKSGEDENPLKSLFDQDGAKGGIEEDRSIASEGIDDQNSALFEKISKKYAKVHGERRIEANNLE